jgi:alpha-glucosidase
VAVWPGQDPHAPIPVYLGLHPQGSYLVFFENPFPAVFQAGPGRLNSEGKVEFQPWDEQEEDGDSSFSQISFEDGLLRYYFIPGSPEKAIERYTELTGRPGLPPRWSLGYHQSRWGYKTEEDIRSVVVGFQQHELPLSAIHLDIDYMDGYRAFTVNLERFPDLAGLSKDLHGQGQAGHHPGSGRESGSQL